MVETMDETSIMTPIDPEQLLKALDTLLGTDGDIKGADEAERIVEMMKEADKLVSRCIYLNVLQATSNNAVLEKLVAVGGWDTLNRWLKDAKAADNSPMLMEILKAYAVMPVDIDLLKKNSCAKTIKQLSRSDNEDLKKLAGDIVEEWTKSIKRTDNVTEKSSKKKEKKHHQSRQKKDKESPNKSASKSSSKELVDENSNDSTSTSDSLQSAQNNCVSKSSNSASPGIKTRPKSARAQMSKSKSTGLEVEIPPAKKKKVPTATLR